MTAAEITADLVAGGGEWASADYYRARNQLERACHSPLWLLTDDKEGQERTEWFAWLTKREMGGKE